MERWKNRILQIPRDFRETHLISFDFLVGMSLFQKEFHRKTKETTKIGISPTLHKHISSSIVSVALRTLCEISFNWVAATPLCVLRITIISYYPCLDSTAVSNRFLGSACCCLIPKLIVILSRPRTIAHC